MFLSDPIHFLKFLVKGSYIKKSVLLNAVSCKPLKFILILLWVREEGMSLDPPCRRS